MKDDIMLDAPESDEQRSFAVGVYGYTFTRPFSVADLSFLPLYEWIEEARSKARDKNKYHLTGVLILSSASLSGALSRRNVLFDIEAALTFIEQQRVALSNIIELKPGEDIITVLRSNDNEHEIKGVISAELNVTDSLTHHDARPSLGYILQPDVFHSDMRTNFLHLIYKNLQDQSFLEESGFRSAFFRNVEW